MKTVLKLATLIGAMTITLAAQAAGPSLTTLQDSVVRLDMSDGSCSGWILKGSNKVMTAGHCFEGSKTNGPVEALITFNDGHVAKYQVSKLGDASSVLRDFAVLVPEGDPGKLPAGLAVCKDAPYYGEPIVLMGSPLGVNKVMFFGEVANPSYKTYDGDPFKDVAGGVVINSQMFPGNSGGPIMDMNTGCVLAQAELLLEPTSGIASGIAVGIPITAEEVL